MTYIDEFLPTFYLVFPMSNTTPSVAIVLTPQISPFLLAVPRMILCDLPQPQHRLRPILCAEKPGEVLFEGGLYAQAEADFSAFEEADMVIVPHWHDVAEPPSEALSRALREAYARLTPIVGLCRGAFAIAYAGLLDGKRATAHWMDAEFFQKTFPQVHLEPSHLYVTDGLITTSAGIAAGMDCCLHVLRSRAGAHVANEVARLMVAPPFRDGGQAQFVSTTVPLTTRDQRINEALDEVSRNFAQQDPFAGLPERLGMSTRTFYRVFEKATGLTPSRWLMRLRLKHSQDLLETQSLSIERIAELCGFASPITFRQRFKAEFGVSPSQWRHAFSSDDRPGMS